MSLHNEVRTFLKNQPSVMTEYMSIETSLNTTISLSGGHLIYARKRSTAKFNAL